MHRRRVLKLMAAASIGIAVPLGFNLPAIAEALSTVSLGGAQYRVHDRVVVVSDDDGQTWREHTDFGDELPVRQLALEGGRLCATVDYRSWSFALALADDRRTWTTA